MSKLAEWATIADHGNCVNVCIYGYHPFYALGTPKSPFNDQYVMQVMRDGSGLTFELQGRNGVLFALTVDDEDDLKALSKIVAGE